MKKYKINEIFYSIQGEGFHVGTPMIFIRFAECNLNCSFCDTDYSEKHQLTVIEILKKIEQYDCDTVLLTGGEPALQIENHFIYMLKQNDYTIHIETNGIQSLPENIDWITISPKSDDSWKLKEGNELKLVYNGQILGKYEQYRSNFDFFYLQPMSMRNIPQTINAVKENKIWKLSIQVQKLLKIR